MLPPEHSTAATIFANIIKFTQYFLSFVGKYQLSMIIIHIDREIEFMRVTYITFNMELKHSLNLRKCITNLVLNYFSLVKF